jgi:2-amino-4-hydroxy-6-hydroxymethyldihydropteridine diphosphokinase
MNTAYLLIGGNLGDRAAYLKSAISRINELCGTIMDTSSIYETAAWGNTDQPNFYNQAVILNTSLTPLHLIQKLLEIEIEMGRVRKEKYGPRTIDLDILMIDQQVFNTELLTLPHPALPNRRFALLPLLEIAPTIWHPVHNCLVSDLLNRCADQLDVQKK